MDRGARLVVVGAGFAGASLLRHLPPPLRKPGETLLIDRREDWTFIPLAHEVAVGRVHPDSVRSPISPLTRNTCAFLRADVAGVDPAERVLHTSEGTVGYEYLVLNPGSVAAHPPAPLEKHVQTFWNIEDALALRGALNHAWNLATSPEITPPGLLNVAVVGGGATGVELAGEVASLFDYLKKRSHRRPLEEPKVVLFEATDRLMGWLDPYFDKVARQTLANLGVEVRLNTPVDEADQFGVRFGGEFLPAATRVWAAGVEASPLVRELPGKHDGSGRVAIDEHLTLPDHPEVYVLGDAGLYTDPKIGPLPPTASVAVQQGPWTARDLKRRMRGAGSRRGRPPFRFFDRGYVVSLGPESAVADAVGLKLRGPAAQALYRSVFLYYMKSRRDRLVTGADWAMERALGRLGFQSEKPEEAS
ncbi:MAG: NADH dehydrogenase [uncultured Rubrobacteraceae bacterium]|uniref:NADH dehydrogenase n=1 Tax=uncultured Rubrobacteraceae bacterium TaxID=349277 RepID=A0A6J4PZQ2_9ACTN|nr:MAG: NADH dehydrogenase [uncultured Rubrobacteraceae bacterium]